MLKNIIWMGSGLALGLLIWLAYTQYKKAKDKKAAENAAVAAPATTPTAPAPTTGTAPATTTTTTGTGVTPSTVTPTKAPVNYLSA